MIDTVLATPDDLDAIADLIYQIECYYFGDAAASRAATAQYVGKNFFQPHCGVQVALAKDGDDTLGIATFSILYPAPSRGGQLYLNDLFTTDAARHRGVCCVR